MKRIFILVYLVSFPFLTWSQFGGGVSDGSQEQAIPKTRIDGLFTNIPFTGDKGDGSDMAYTMLNLSNIDISSLYQGGTGDGYSHNRKMLIMGLDNYNVVFGGSFGDGHSETYRQTTIDGLLLQHIYAGGMADGEGNDYRQVQFGLSDMNYFGGGIGDGEAHQNLVSGLSVDASKLYTGGVGDGHDNIWEPGLNFPATVCVGSRLYVDIDAFGNGTGLSWQHAVNALPLAFENAKICPVDEIWVSEGVYLPTTNNDRTISLKPPSDLAILGGFSGVETSGNHRDWTENETILSGNIGTSLDNDNSYHVVDFSSTNGSTRIDGFIIEGGNADDLVNGESKGAGMINTNPTSQQNHLLINTVIRECSSIGSGTALYMTGTMSELQLQNVMISEVNAPGRKLIEVQNQAVLKIIDKLSIDL